jgi:hypothetical protein
MGRLDKESIAQYRERVLSAADADLSDLEIEYRDRALLMQELDGKAPPPSQARAPAAALREPALNPPNSEQTTTARKRKSKGVFYVLLHYHPLNKLSGLGRASGDPFPIAGGSDAEHSRRAEEARAGRHGSQCAALILLCTLTLTPICIYRGRRGPPHLSGHSGRRKH